MNVAELFVSLGIKGADKTVGALTGVKKGLQDVASTSLETKAAIIGAMYALERLFAASGKTGTDLANFNSLLGVSAQTLQQYQYAARQVGVSNQEVEGTFKSLQGAVTKTLLGEGAPKGLARVAQLTGGITAQDLKRFQEQPQLLIQKLQEYAQKETSTGLRNEVLKSFGITDNMISAFNRNAFRPDMLAKAPAYNDSEIKSLDRANIAWSNLGNQIEMAVGHFNALHGGQLVGDISKIVEQIIKLANAFVLLSEKAHIFEIIEKTVSASTEAIKLFTKILEGFATGKELGAGGFEKPAVEGKEKALPTAKEVVDRLEVALLSGGQNESISGVLYDFVRILPSIIGDTKGELPKPKDLKSGWPFNKEEKPVPVKPAQPIPVTTKTPLISAPALESTGKASGAGVRGLAPAPAPTAPALRPGAPALHLVVPKAPNMPAPAAIAPAVPPAVPTPGSPAPSIEVNQTLNFNHDGSNATQTGDSTKKAVKDAFRQLSAQAQGT